MALSQSELDAVNQLRTKMNGTIPSNLDTDFQLRRWTNAYEGNLDGCAAKFTEYLENRHVLGFDKPEFVTNFYQNESFRKHGCFLTASTLNPSWVNPMDNGIIFVEMSFADPKKVPLASIT